MHLKNRRSFDILSKCVILKNEMAFTASLTDMHMQIILFDKDKINI